VHDAASAAVRPCVLGKLSVAAVCRLCYDGYVYHVQGTTSAIVRPCVRWGGSAAAGRGPLPVDNVMIVMWIACMARRALLCARACVEEAVRPLVVARCR
jgi:hypothetical protein